MRFTTVSLSHHFHIRARLKRLAETADWWECASHLGIRHCRNATEGPTTLVGLNGLIKIDTKKIIHKVPNLDFVQRRRILCDKV